MDVATEHPYIVKNQELLSGEPLIRGTKTPVRSIVERWRLGMRPEEITDHLPHVSLAAVFDALSYFSDHQQEVLAYIERNRVPEDLVHPAVRGH